MSAVQNGRLSFGKIPKVLDTPDLLIIQKESFNSFINKDQMNNQPSGLQEILDEISPIQDFSGRFILTFKEQYCWRTKKGY